VAKWAAGRYLAPHQIELRSLDGLELVPGGISLADMTLAGAGFMLNAQGVRAGLAPFRIEQLEVSSLRLAISAREPGTAGTTPLPDPSTLLQSIHALPLDVLAVDHLEIALNGTEFRGRFHASRRESTSPVNADSDSAPERLRFHPTLLAHLEIESPWAISLRAESPGPGRMSASITGPDGLAAGFTGAVSNTEIEGVMEASLSLPETVALLAPGALSPAGYASLGGPFKLGFTDADSDFAFTSPGLRLSAPELIVNPDADPSEALSIRADLHLDQLVLRHSRANGAGAGRWHASGHFASQSLETPWLARPGLEGSVQWSGSGLRANATLRAGEHAVAKVEWLHGFDGGGGFADLEIPRFAFDRENPLSALLIMDLPNADLVAGSVSGAGRVEWGAGAVSGDLRLRLADLDGHFGETALFDLDTELAIELRPDLSLASAAPLQASLARIDPGLPLERLNWTYRFDSAERTIEIRGLRADFLDGQIALPVIRLTRGEPIPDVNLALTEIDLAAAASLVNRDELEVTGRVSGYLPLRIDSGAVRIEDGHIGALPPGGTIRYTPRQRASDPRMRTVNELLSDYRFDTLDSQVQLDRAGDLLLQAEITGTSPGVNPNQPIQLNLNISNNIPDLLRSLRAGRDISRMLEGRLETR